MTDVQTSESYLPTKLDSELLPVEKLNRTDPSELGFVEILWDK